MKIYKYTIDIDTSTHHIPRGAKFLNCQLQNNQIVSWFLVDPSTTATDIIEFTVIGTGHDVPKHLDKNNYLSTLQFGPLVLHVFATNLG